MTTTISGTSGIQTSAVTTTGAVAVGTALSAATESFTALPAVTTPQSMVRLNIPNGYGSTNTGVRRFSTVVVNQGSDITYADSATLGALFTINTNGVYSISYSDAFAAAADFQITLNATTLTGVATVLSEILTEGTTFAAATRSTVAVTPYLLSGSIIRAQTSGTGNSRTFFTITRVS